MDTVNAGLVEPAAPDLERWFWAGRWLLILMVPLAYPLAMVLPVTWGWENGVFEDSQVVVLLAGLVVALMAFRRLPRPVAMMGLFAAPFWFMAAARELSWGAVFLTPLEITGNGPVFSSRMLWYKAAVHPTLALLLALALFVLVRFRIDRLIVTVWRNKRFPWVELGLIVLGALASTVAEGHLHIEALQLDLSAARQEVFEELMELVAYSALFLAQLRVLHALGCRTVRDRL